MTVDAIIGGILQREGSKYTNDPNDSGKATRFGITQAVLASWRRVSVTENDVRNLTESEARSIYVAKYVDAPGFRQVIAISPAIAAELIDTGVNMGPARAAEMLQRVLNALNRQERDYPDVKVDMECGPGTIAALRAYVALRRDDGVTVILRALNCLQGAAYISLAERRPKDESFVFGWFLGRVS